MKFEKQPDGSFIAIDEKTGKVSKLKKPQPGRSLAEVRPDLIEEWDQEKNGELTPYDISAGAAKIKPWWKCQKCGHSYKRRLYNKLNGYIMCPMCYKREASKINQQINLHKGENDLLTWCSNHGEYGQSLIEEYTGEIDNGWHLGIDEITFGSSLGVKWRCKKCGNEWTTPPANRTYSHSGCKVCSKRLTTSYPEQLIYWCLKQIYTSAESDFVVLKSKERPMGVSFDIGIPEIPLCIEYSPRSTHAHREEMDKFKEEQCRLRGIRFIQIVIDDSMGKEINIEYKTTPNYICYKMDRALSFEGQVEITLNTVNFILNTLGHSISEVDIQRAKDNAFKVTHGWVEESKSLAITHPELAKEWNYELNGEITPLKVTHGSGVEVYWMCPNCGHGKNGEWKRQCH